MGVFDTVEVLGRSGQVKCFGSHLDVFNQGDIVGPLMGHQSYSIAMREGGYVNVTWGKIESWTDGPIHSEIFDKWGTRRYLDEDYHL